MSSMPISMERRYGQNTKSACRDAEAMWTRICKDCDRRKPELLILSSEFFFRDPQNTDYVKLRNMLGEISSRIDIVMYVREPAVRFAALLQQGAKQDRPIRPIDGTQVQRGLPRVEDAFGQKVNVCLYERDSLIGNDIVTDFVKRFVTPVVGDVVAPTLDSNESISAEAAVTLLGPHERKDIRSLRQKLGFGRFRDVVLRVDNALPGKRSARLKPSFAADIRRANLDALWLRERHGIVFSDFDYGQVDGVLPDYDTTKLRAADLLALDETRLREMERSVVASVTASQLARSVASQVKSLLGLSRKKPQVRRES